MAAQTTTKHIPHQATSDDNRNDQIHNTAMEVLPDQQTPDRPSKRPRMEDLVGEDDTGGEHSLNIDHLTKCFETNSICGVCNNPFDEKHAPVRLTCGRGLCQHILGFTCTLDLDLDRMRIEEECAACAPVLLELRRASLFLNEPRHAYGHDKISTCEQRGTQTEFLWKAWIEDIDTHEGAEFFTKLMWVETSYLSNKGRDGVTVYNSDIEECVVEALMRMGRHHPYCNKTFYLKQEHWPYFLSSMRQLLRVHITSTGYCRMTDEAINGWKLEFQKVLEWKLPALL